MSELIKPDLPYNSSPKVAFVSFAYSLAQSPSTVFLAEILAEKGYSVDIFINKQGFFNVEFANPRICVRTMGELVPQPDIKEEDGSVNADRRQLRASKRSVVNFIPLWMRLLGPFALWLRRNLMREVYRFVVSIESEALVVAAVLNYFRRIPMVFYSMELRLSHEPDENVKTDWRVPKVLEKWAHRKTRFTLIQDEYRAAALAKENKVPLAAFLKVPEGMKGPQVVGRSDLLYRRLDLPTGVRILLYVGNIAPWAKIIEIIEGIQRWPRNWIFVVHGFVSDVDYIRRIKSQLPLGKVFLSTQLLPHGEMDQLVLSADVGVAIYPADVSNMRLTASASGKIAQYLKCGLPIIVNDFKHTRRMIDEYRCGICIKDPLEVGRALLEIEENYGCFAANTADLYCSHYMIDPWLKKMLATIESTLKEPARS